MTSKVFGSGLTFLRGNSFFGVLLILFILSLGVNLWSDRSLSFVSVSSGELKLNSSEAIVENRASGGDSQSQSGTTNIENGSRQGHSLCSNSIFNEWSSRRLWIHHASRIHAASQLEDDVHFAQHDFMAQLLAIITPRIDQSIKSLTKDWQLVSQILEKGYKRYRYLSLQEDRESSLRDEHNNEGLEDEDVPEPVRITVLGGSITRGIYCSTEIAAQITVNATRQCAWPYRLERLVNEFFAVGPLIQVSNEAMDGAWSNMGVAVLKYNLINSVLENSDILIHAYASNDLPHVFSNEARHKRFWDILQEFVRLVFRPPRQLHCRSRPNLYSTRSSTSTIRSQPLLIHMNDALIPSSLSIHKYSSMTHIVSSLANYYGFISLSYVDMIRDYVYHDPMEQWFSSVEGSNAFDIHAGHSMHILIAWMVAYSVLHITTAFCSFNNDFWRPMLMTPVTDMRNRQTRGDDKGYSGGDDDSMLDAMHGHATSFMYVADYEATILTQSVPLIRNGTDTKSEGIEPRIPPPYGLLPSLDSTITMSDLNAGWREDTKKIRQQQIQPCPRSERKGSIGLADTCPLAWVSGLDVSKNQTWVQENIISRLTNSSSWSLADHANIEKMGLAPQRGDLGATMKLEFPLSEITSDRPIATVVMIYLKSFGEEWKHSRARIEIFKSQSSSSRPISSNDLQQKLAEAELVGVHKRHNTEIYQKEITLPRINSASDATLFVPAEETLSIQATLIDGQTFRIMGLALCH